MKKFFVKNNQGYTIIELMVVTGIIVVVSGLIAGILYSTLRGGNKSNTINSVAQNGNYALSVMSNTVLNSIGVTKVGGTSVTNCTSSPTGNSIELEQPDGSLISFACSNNSIASTSGQITTDLIDTNTVQVDPLTCSFTCLQNNNDSLSLPIISIAFTVSQKKINTTFENTASSAFSTSVTMRNYNPR